MSRLVVYIFAWSSFVAASTLHTQTRLHRSDEFLAGGAESANRGPLQSPFQGGAPSLRNFLLVLFALIGVGALTFSIVAYLLLVPMMAARKRQAEGWAMCTWWAFDSEHACREIAKGIPGMVWLTEKRNLALLMHLRKDGMALPTPPSFLVQGGGTLCLSGVSVDGGCAPWFMKNSNVDCCDDNNCFDTLEGCVQENKKFVRIGKPKVAERLAQSYVAQPHVARPLLLEGHKFDMRVHVVCVARKAPVGESITPESTSGLLQAFMFEDVIVKLARDPWNPDKLESAAQHTNMHGAAQGSSFHQRLLRNVPQSTEILRSVKHAIEGCLETARGVLHQGADVNARQILGVDVMVDEDLRAWVLEFNYYPGDDPNCMAPGVYEVAYLPIKRDLPEMTSRPILEGRPAQALKGWQELRF